jgi:hypothetical protein
MPQSGSVDILIDAPDRQSALRLIDDLKERLGAGSVVVLGAGPEVPENAPPPPRYVVTAYAAIRGRPKDKVQQACLAGRRFSW